MAARIDLLAEGKLLAKKQRGILLNVEKYTEERFAKQFNPDKLIQRIKNSSKAYLGPDNGVGNFTVSQVALLHSRGYTLEAFRKTMEEYDLTKAQLCMLIRTHSIEKSILANIKPANLKRLAQKTGLTSYFIKQTFLLGSSDFTVKDFIVLAERLKNLGEKYNIPLYIVMREYRRHTNVEPLLEKLITTAKKEGLSIDLTYTLFFERNADLGGINKKLITLSEMYIALLKDKVSTGERFIKGLEDLKRQMEECDSYEEALDIGRRLEELKKVRPTKEVEKYLIEGVGSSYFFLRRLVSEVSIASSSSLEEEKESQGVYSGLKDKNVRLAIQNIKKAKEEIAKVLREVSEGWNEFNENILPKFKQKRAELRVNMTLDTRESLRKTLRDKLNNSVSHILKQSSIEQLAKDIPRLLFGWKKEVRDRSQNNFITNKFILYHYIPFIENEEWSSIKENGFAESFADALIENIINLKEKLKLSDNLIVGAVRKGYSYLWVKNLDKQYPDLKKRFLARMFKTQNPERYLLCNIGPLREQTEGAKLFFEYFNKLSERSPDTAQKLFDDATQDELMALILNNRVNKGVETQQLAKEASRVFIRHHLWVIEEMAEKKDSGKQGLYKNLVQEGTKALYKGLDTYNLDYKGRNSFADHT